MNLRGGRVTGETRPEVPQRRLAGLDRPVSALIMGCDNQESLATAAPLWDAWMEAGGNAFDTAYIYGEGKHEAMLGEWIAALEEYGGTGGTG